MIVKFPKTMGRKQDGILTKWLAADGANVEEGDRLFAYETSKMASDILSPAAGILHHVVSEGERIKYDQTVATIE